MTQFIPTRRAGLERLEAFLPRAGRQYQRDRNFDHGPDQRSNVSVLSPWLSHRLLSDWEVVQAAVDAHGLSAAGKFVDEVMWRTYWRGWLEQHRQVWDDYRSALREPLPAALARAVEQACQGRTGIACFDAWAEELERYGYLHNHARMWFASIWVFTLRLPWEHGADFFMRHLVDADAASNTLSWRWVAGQHTQGKCYLASESNIRRFTDGRFPATPGLAGSSGELPDQERPALNTVVHESGSAVGRSGLLLSESDLSGPELPPGNRITTVATLPLRQHRSAQPLGEAADTFSGAALQGAAEKLAGVYGIDTVQPLADPEDVLELARTQKLDAILMSRCPVGPGFDEIKTLAQTLSAEGVTFQQVSRRWDEVCWPFCRKGFFQFKRQIPGIVVELTQFPGA